MTKKLISVKEAAEILQVSKLTLRNWDRDGKLTAYRHPMNNYRLYDPEEIENLLHKMRSREKPIHNTRKKKSEIWKVAIKHLSD